MKVENIDKLNRDELCRLLIENVQTGCESTQQLQDIRSYYDLCGIEILRAKVRELCNDTLYDTPPIVTDMREIRRRNHLMEQRRQVTHTIIKDIKIPSNGKDAEWELQTELMGKDWCETCTVISPGLLGVKCPEEKKKVVERIKKRIGYEGFIAYG